MPITVCVSVDWEGRNLDGIDAMKELNELVPGIPITHFISAAYLSRTSEPEEIDRIVDAMLPAIKIGDEVALHLHCWKTLYDYGDQGHLYTTNSRYKDEPQKYAGQTYEDTGYVVELSSLEEAVIKRLYDASLSSIQPLLEKLKKHRGGVWEIRGFRSGGWMTDDTVFEVLASKDHLIYDASAVDWLFRKRAQKWYLDILEPMVKKIESLWGPDIGETNRLNHRNTAGCGVNRMMEPYKIGRLVELPNNGMLVSAVTVKNAQDFLQWALTRIAQLPQQHVYVSIGFHQESPSASISEFAQMLLGFSANPDIRWRTHQDHAERLIANS